MLNFRGVNHIVQTFESFTYKDKYYTVMELMDKGKYILDVILVVK